MGSIEELRRFKARLEELTGTPITSHKIEDQGGLVVADDLCTTSRTFWHLADEDGDPMVALAALLDRRALCACMHPMEARLERGPIPECLHGI